MPGSFGQEQGSITQRIDRTGNALTDCGDPVKDRGREKIIVAATGHMKLLFNEGGCLRPVEGIQF
ncbi:MAG: hypothetical protein R3F37_04695 [Candidatus Competibacteraceae bacterium]